MKIRFAAALLPALLAIAYAGTAAAQIKVGVTVSATGPAAFFRSSTLSMDGWYRGACIAQPEASTKVTAVAMAMPYALGLFIETP